MPEGDAHPLPSDRPAPTRRGDAAPGDGDGDGRSGRPSGRWRARLLAVAATVLVLAFLKWAQAVTMPLAFGVFLAVLLWPLQVRLERRLPRRLAFAISVLVLLAVVAGFFAALWWSGAKVAERAPEYAQRLDEMASSARQWAAARGLPLPAGGVSGEAAQGLVRRAALAAYSSLIAIVLVLAFAILALLEGHVFQEKARRGFRRRRHARGVVESAERIAVRFQQYLWARVVVAVVQGVTAWLVALLLGLDFALVWGLIAALLNFIPSVGSVLAIIPPTLFATLQFDGWTRPLLVFGAMALLQIVLGNFVDPKIEGRFLQLSPLVVLFAIIFWGWLWGVGGALLGVPIMVALAIVCDEMPQTRWLAAMLVGKPPEADRATAARGAGK
jgi:predicted PurR-regulated permease PerM